MHRCVGNEVQTFSASDRSADAFDLIGQEVLMARASSSRGQNHESGKLVKSNMCAI